MCAFGFLAFSVAYVQQGCGRNFGCEALAVSSLGVVNTCVLQPSEFLSFDSSNPSTTQSCEVDGNLQVISFCGLYTIQSGDKEHLLCFRTLSGYQNFQTFTTPYLSTFSLHNTRLHSLSLSLTHTHTHTKSFN